MRHLTPTLALMLGIACAAAAAAQDTRVGPRTPPAPTVVTPMMVKPDLDIADVRVGIVAGVGLAGIHWNVPVPVNHAFMVCMAVRNVGGSSTGAPVQVTGSAIGRAAGPTVSVPTLAAGASASACLNYEQGAPNPGSRQITVRVDPNNAVAELHEDNNQAAATVNVIQP